MEHDVTDLVEYFPLLMSDSGSDPESQNSYFYCDRITFVTKGLLNYLTKRLLLPMSQSL